MSEYSLNLEEIDFGMLEMAFEDDSFEHTGYLDLREDRVVFLSDYGDIQEEDELREQIESDTEDRFLHVPPGSSDVAWRDMQRFALSLEDEELSNQLLDTIQGSGAFRRFKESVDREGIRQDWFEFRDRRVRRRVLDWLLAKELITEQQAEEYRERLDEEIRRRKERKRELREMGEGDVVECIDSSGSPGLSEGTRYEAAGERPGDELVRVKDDRGKVCWYPKPKFTICD